MVKKQGGLWVLLEAMILHLKVIIRLFEALLDAPTVILLYNTRILRVPRKRTRQLAKTQHHVASSPNGLTRLAAVSSGSASEKRPYSLTRMAISYEGRFSENDIRIWCFLR